MRVFVYLLGIILSFQVMGNERLIAAQITPATSQLDLTPFMHVLVDTEHIFQITDLLTSDFPLKFKPLSDTGNSFGFDKAVYWVKFSITFDESLSESFYLQYHFPVIDNITLYRLNDEGGYSESVTGDHYPFAQREINFRNFLFKLDYSAGETRHYVMRLQTEGSLQIPLSLWSSSALIELSDTVSLAYGFYYGVMALLMCAAALTYLLTKDFLFLSYSLYLFSFLMFQLGLNGIGFQYFWSEMNTWVNKVNAISLGSTVVFGFLFCGTFLKVWQQQERFKYFYYVLMSIGILSILFSLFGDFSIALIIAASAGILLPPVVFISNIYSIHAGYRPAKFFLAAWGIFLVGVFVAGLLYFGWVERNFYTHNAMQIASLIEVLILGYVLIENVQDLNRQKIKASIDASKYLKQLNMGLEAQVEERTRELKELALRDSMTGLLNHNTVIEQLSLLTKAAQRYQHQLSVIMIDIDLFKLVNDRFGHPSGDKLIIAIADILQKSLRESDVCGRYGGEEFILLLPETSGSVAQTIAENIRKKIMLLEIVEIKNTKFTSSFGVSVFDPEQPKADLINQADIALYQAKERGRNRVVLFTSSDSTI